MRLAALLLALLAGPALAEPIPYPPSTCAALWEAFADRFGDDGGPDGGERALAARFRAWSDTLVGAAETGRLVAERRPWMRDLLDAYVLGSDRQSRELLGRLVEGCGAMAADLPPSG